MIAKRPERIAWRRSLNRCADKRGNPDPIGGRVAVNQDASKRILIRAHLYSHGGYGQLAEQLGRALEGLGVPVAYEPICVDEQYLPVGGWVEDRLVEDPPDAAELLLAPPMHDGPTSRRRVWFSMWETTRLPDGAVDAMNRCGAVVVPNHFNAACFSAQGVAVPIVVAPLGVDRSVFAPEGPPPPEGPPVFGVVARHAHGGVRKNTVDAARAFCEAFPRGDEDARFRVKCWPDCRSYLAALPDDPRIEVDTRSLTTPELVAWMRACTVGCCVSRAEGWGLVAHQFAALARPVIACLGTGHADFLDPAGCYPIPFGWSPARDFYDPRGLWMEPDRSAIVAAMRTAHQDRQDCAGRGLAASVAAGRFTWERCATAVLDAFLKAGVRR